MTGLPEVVRATVRGVPDVVAMLAHTAAGRMWYTADGYRGEENQDWHWHYDRHVTDRRPLVLIDPEDREQVEALVEAFHRGDKGNLITNTHDMQAALRAIAEPTPPEPQGLGAVVRDAEGRAWIHCPDGTRIDHWRSLGKIGGWKDIVQPAEVLSEGVTS